MYTFAPIASVYPGHEGFVLICVAAFLFVLIAGMTEDIAAGIAAAFPAAFVVLLAYCVSYVWTDQGPTKVYKNEPVTGEFVRYVAEGYNITVQSGKSTRHVDRHEVYVVYRINGNEVLFRGQEGIEYPKTAILYKN